jgi:hypothetical protein
MLLFNPIAAQCSTCLQEFERFKADWLQADFPAWLEQRKPGIDYYRTLTGGQQSDLSLAGRLYWRPVNSWVATYVAMSCQPNVDPSPIPAVQLSQRSMHPPFRPAAPQATASSTRSSTLRRSGGSSSRRRARRLRPRSWKTILRPTHKRHAVHAGCALGMPRMLCSPR